MRRVMWARGHERRAHLLGSIPRYSIRNNGSEDNKILPGNPEPTRPRDNLRTNGFSTLPSFLKENTDSQMAE